MTFSRCQRLVRRAIGCYFLAALPACAQTISIESPSVDIGTVARGTPIIQQIAIKNTGSAELRINDVKAACACTTVKFDKKILPGGVGNITLTIDTRNFRGPISKSADVLSNDPINPSKKIIVTANVKGLITVMKGDVPSENLRIEAASGRPSAAQVSVISDNPKFKPTTPTTTARYLSATLTPTDSPSRWKLLIIADSTAPVGPIAEAVTIQTGMMEEPQLRIPITGLVRNSEPSAESVRPSEAPFTNDAVVKLVSAGLPDEVVIAKVKNAGSVQFDLSTEALVTLKNQSVSGAVIASMIDRAAQKHMSTPPAETTAQSQQPSNPCDGIELMGLYKNEIFDRAMGGGVVEWLAQVRNNTSVTKMVSVGWIDEYGQQQRAQVQIKGGDIARPRLDLTKVRYVAPVREVRLISCE